MPAQVATKQRLARLDVRVAWLCGVVLLFEGYVIAAAGYDSGHRCAAGPGPTAEVDDSVLREKVSPAINVRSHYGAHDRAKILGLLGFEDLR